MTEKFCKDCANFRSVPILWRNADHLTQCARQLEPVLGKPAYFCDQERKWGGCGPSGKYWVEAPLRQFWK